MGRSRRAVGADRAVVAGRAAPGRSPGTQASGQPEVLSGILFVLYTGIAWEFLPQELGFVSGMTCWRRLRDWHHAGVWENPHQVTAFAADDVWVAGVDYGDDERPTQVTLPHYNGRRWARDCRDGGGEICGDGFTITRVPTTSRLLRAGRAHCGDENTSSTSAARRG